MTNQLPFSRYRAICRSRVASRFPCSAPRGRWRVLVLCCLLLLPGAIWPVAIRAGDDPCGQCADKELWQISTRHLGCAYPTGEPDYEVTRFDTQQGWRSDSLEQLAQANAESPLVVYVHGNRVTACDAQAEGRAIYRALFTTADDVPHVTFVIWSWPSSQIRGPLKDVRFKARRADVEGCLLAHWLAQVPAQRPVALVGHSFGARIVTGGLHLAGGGTLAGCQPAPDGSPRTHTRVVLLAAALHNYWLRPGCYHERALSQTRLLTNLYNSCDRVLRRYRMLDRCARAEALGYTGMYTGDVPESDLLLVQEDVCCAIGSAHGANAYFANGHIRQMILAGILGTDLDP